MVATRRHTFWCLSEAATVFFARWWSRRFFPQIGVTKGQQGGLDDLLAGRLGTFLHNVLVKFVAAQPFWAPSISSS